jgi:hypothetical protein
MFRTAVWARKAQWVGPDEGQTHAINVDLEINQLLGLGALREKMVHRVLPNSRENAIGLPISLTGAPFVEVPWHQIKQFALQCGFIAKC